MGVLAVVGAHIGIDRAVEVDVVHASTQSIHIELVGIVERETEVGTAIRHNAGKRTH